jgi:hypothetical protein
MGPMTHLTIGKPYDIIIALPVTKFRHMSSFMTASQRSILNLTKILIINLSDEKFAKLRAGGAGARGISNLHPPPLAV